MWVVADANLRRRTRREETAKRVQGLATLVDGQCRGVDKCLLFGVSDDVANRMDRLHAAGNGQVPSVAATAFRILSEGLI